METNVSIPHSERLNQSEKTGSESCYAAIFDLQVRYLEGNDIGLGQLKGEGYFAVWGIYISNTEGNGTNIGPLKHG